MPKNEEEIPEKERKKPYPSLRKLARKKDASYARREKKK
jgi:hypothetical protein